MTHVTCRLTAKNRDQLRNPTLGSRVRATFLLPPVVKVLLDARERRFCTPDYWQIAFMHIQVRKNAQERWAERYMNGCTYDQMTTTLQKN